MGESILLKFESKAHEILENPEFLASFMFAVRYCAIYSHSFARLSMCELPVKTHLARGYMIETTSPSFNKSLVLHEKINIIYRIPSWSKPTSNPLGDM